MTVKEFWHLKYGTIVEEVVYGDRIAWRGKVIKREVIDECIGFIMTKSETHDIKSGKKLLEITFDTGRGLCRYVATDKPYTIKDLRVSQEKSLLPYGNFI